MKLKNRRLMTQLPRLWLSIVVIALCCSCAVEVCRKSDQHSIVLDSISAAILDECTRLQKPISKENEVLMARLLHPLCVQDLPSDILQRNMEAIQHLLSNASEPYYATTKLVYAECCLIWYFHDPKDEYLNRAATMLASMSDPTPSLQDAPWDFPDLHYEINYFVLLLMFHRRQYQRILGEVDNLLKMTAGKNRSSATEEDWKQTIPPVRWRTRILSLLKRVDEKVITRE